MIKADLLIIDPQNDFCNPSGSLFVPGADADMARLAQMVTRLSGKISDIHLTLDLHSQFDIAHPLFWRDSKGNHPAPFTTVSIDDVRKGALTPVHASMYNYVLSYVESLEANGRYQLMIWPPHCLIGSSGANIVPELAEALFQWERDHVAIVNKVSKGSNFKTEHYSAIKADVPDPSDPGTDLNMSLINTLQQVDEIAVAGEASSHCLGFTLKDIVDNIGDEHLKKFVILEDACSPVPGFEQQAKDFFDEFKARGLRFSTTTEYLR